MAKTLCRVAGGGKPLKGNAETGDVLAGKTFSNKQSNALTGTMPNNGTWTSSSSGSGKVTIPAGYHNGSGYVDCSGAYNKGVTDADNRANSNSANYKAGYNKGYTNGNSVKPSNMIIGACMNSQQEGFPIVGGSYGRGCYPNGMQIIIQKGYYYHIQIYSGVSQSWVDNHSGYANSQLTFTLVNGNPSRSVGLAVTSNYPLF